MQNGNDKPFYLSSGFIISIIGMVLTLVMSIADHLPAEVTAYIMAGIGGLYIIARAIGKAGEQHDSKSKKFYQTSEFWMATLGAVISTVTWLGDLLPADVSAKILGVLTGAYTIGRRVTKIGDPIDTVTSRKLDDVIKAIKENGGKVGAILILCTGSMTLTGCSLFNMDAPEPIPFATYVQFFDPVEGEAARLHELYDKAEAGGILTATKARSMRNRLDAQIELTDELSSGSYETIDVTAERPAVTDSE